MNGRGGSPFRARSRGFLISPWFEYTPTLTRLPDDTTTGVGMPHPQTHCLEAPYPQNESGSQPFNGETFYYGRVSHVHGHGIDQRLAIVRYEYSDTVPQPVTLLPRYPRPPTRRDRSRAALLKLA